MKISRKTLRNERLRRIHCDARKYIIAYLEFQKLDLFAIERQELFMQKDISLILQYSTLDLKFRSTNRGKSSPRYVAHFISCVIFLFSFYIVY